MKTNEQDTRGWATRNMHWVWPAFGLFMLVLFLIENVILAMDRIR